MAQDDCMKQHMHELKQNHPDWEQAQLVAVALKKCGESNKEAQTVDIEKAPNKANMAYTPDDVPSHWKLDISDDTHIAAAIAALSSNPPHGNKVEIPSDAKAGVIKKIASAINSKVSDADKKAHLKDELAKVKSAGLFSDNEIQVLKQSTVFDQDQVAYTPLSTKQGQACANCVFYRSTAFDGINWPHCLIVENDDPDPIEPTGWCNHWEAKPEPPADPMDALSEMLEDAIENMGGTITEAVSAMATQNEPMEAMEMSYKPKQKNIIQRAKSALFPPKPLTPFSVYKSGDKWYWIAAYTNAYEDKDNEIFTEKAHENYIARLDMGLVDMPELWVWHTKGTAHGKADTVFGVGRMVVAVGHFDDTPAAKNAISFYQKNAHKLKLSHGAQVPKWAIHDGIIESYNTFEISTLPDGMESNPYTSYEAVKAMQPDPKKLEMVAAVLGKEKVEEVVQTYADKTKALDDMQVRYKDFAEVVEADESPTTEAQKNMAEAFVEMVKEQGDIVGLLAKMEKRQNATDELVKQLREQNAAYEKQVADFQKIVAAGPQRPSTSSQTVANPDKVKELENQPLNGNEEKQKMRQFLFGDVPNMGGA